MKQTRQPRVEPLLTAEQVAEILGVSKAFIYAHAAGRRKPLIPSVRIGGAVRFRVAAVEDLIAALERVA